MSIRKAGVDMLNGWNIAVPIPANWQDFENIVTEALKIRYGNPNFTKNGRTGQKQDGVDIYVQNGNNVIAAQCKLTLGSINENIILKEIENAKNFFPSITIFHICTTSPRDVKLQQFVREQSSLVPFSCDLLFWDDIVHLIWLNPVMFQNLFGSIGSINVLEEHDINMINDLFSLINILLIQRTLEMDLPMRIPGEFVYFWENFNNRWTLCTAFFHDQTLQKLVEDFHNYWYEMVTKTSNAFIPTAYGYAFPMPGDVIQSQEQENDYKEIDQLRSPMYKALLDMVDYIQKTYPIIDLEKLSVVASQQKLQFEQNLKRRLNEES